MLCLRPATLYIGGLLSVFTEEEEEEWWADDASDFDLDSDSEGEGERLCNTAMLTGPLGVGKTASVYALAQELGFKVIPFFISINQVSCLGVNFCTEFNFVEGVKYHAVPFRCLGV